jgi:hypothetical protein
VKVTGVRTTNDGFGELESDMGGGTCNGRNPTDPVAVAFREPQVAVGASRDADWKRAGRDAGAEFGDDSEWGNPPDLVAVEALEVRKPQVAVGARRDAERCREKAEAGAEYGDDSERGNPADPGVVGEVAAQFREPQVAVWAGRDAVRWAGGEFGDHSERGNPPDADCMRKPQVAVGPAVMP